MSWWPISTSTPTGTASSGAAAPAPTLCQGLAPPEIPSANLDFDWPRRRAAPAFIASPARLAQSSLASSRQAPNWLGAAPPIAPPAPWASACARWPRAWATGPASSSPCGRRWRPQPSSPCSSRAPSPEALPARPVPLPASGRRRPRLRPARTRRTPGARARGAPPPPHWPAGGFRGDPPRPGPALLRQGHGVRKPPRHRKCYNARVAPLTAFGGGLPLPRPGINIVFAPGPAPGPFSRVSPFWASAEGE